MQPPMSTAFVRKGETIAPFHRGSLLGIEAFVDEHFAAVGPDRAEDVRVQAEEHRAAGADRRSRREASRGSRRYPRSGSAPLYRRTWRERIAQAESPHRVRWRRLAYREPEESCSFHPHLHCRAPRFTKAPIFPPPSVPAAPVPRSPRPSTPSSPPPSVPAAPVPRSPPSFPPPCVPAAPVPRSPRPSTPSPPAENRPFPAAARG